MDDLDYQEQLAGIRRTQEETWKFTAEQHKLIAEALKVERERALYPVALAIGVIGEIIGSVATSVAHGLK
jgi:hypothetical protein